MSMLQRAGAAYTIRQPYDSTPFLSHAQSVSATGSGAGRFYLTVPQAGIGAVMLCLDRAAHGPVSVDYATRDGSEKVDEDYAAPSGTLAFARSNSARLCRWRSLTTRSTRGWRRSPCGSRRR